MTTNITAAHRSAFEALRDVPFQNFALFSCFVDGQPAAAIVAIARHGNEHSITPLFVSVTDTMVLTGDEGQCRKASNARRHKRR